MSGDVFHICLGNEIHALYFSHILGSTSEEDGGFGVYGEKTRYATLQRMRTSNQQPGSHHHPNGGYETLRPNVSASAYNVPSLVSYANVYWFKHTFIISIIPFLASVIINSIFVEPRSYLC